MGISHCPDFKARKDVQAGGPRRPRRRGNGSAAAAATAAAQPTPAPESQPMFELIIHEVRALMSADSSLTSASCITKCDAAMEMDDPQDETRIDEMCKNVCNCEIDHNCQHQQQHQHTPPADAHTPPPHP